MTLKETVIIFLRILRITYPLSYREREDAVLLPKRIHQLMINYNDRCVQRITEMTNIRAKYEYTPHFEIGYVVSEILERYRKMVEHVKKPIQYKSDVLFDTIKQTELVQKLFLEIYNLVNMVNEIPRKYSHMPEFTEQVTYDPIKVHEAYLQMEQNKRNRERERKKRMKDMKKEREMYLKGEINFMKRKPKKPANKWWPIDYGWEIDYYW